jgi:hypothetical protein
MGVIAELRTGLPFGVVEQTNRLNAFSASQRPNLVGDWRLPSGRSRAESINQWFNTDAFAFAGNGVLGNAGRNIGTGPNSVSFDTSLLKDFHFTETKLLQLRGEFFNVLNRPNLGMPNTARGSAAFGSISSASAGRQVQIGLRFVY